MDKAEKNKNRVKQRRRNIHQVKFDPKIYRTGRKINKRLKYV